MIKINFENIEKKWQKKWEKAKVFEVSEKSKKPKYYVLEMFPYPSGSGLHMGHAWNYTIGDILARFKRMQGFNVMHPMGYDSLGLPAENAAIKAGEHPKDYNGKSIPNFTRQMKEIGLSYDWSRTFSTDDSNYYKWDQWIFLKMLEKGLAYQKESAVNWCPKCNTVLANEQVQGGKCWRHEDTEVEVKQLKQWFLKITDYADRLLEGQKKLDWPARTIAMQKNWIGKSYGTEIDFEIYDSEIKNKEFVFLHAYGDNIENSFWQNLKKEIESRGGRVAFAKTLPNTENPKFEEQSKFLLENYTFNKNSIVIGHSLGNVLIMKVLEKINKKINKIIMVAPPLANRQDIVSGNGFRDKVPRPDLAKYCDFNFNFKKVKESAKEIVILSCLNDHIVPLNHGRELAEKLECKLIEAEGMETHFNGDSEPEVEKVVFNKWPIFTTRPDTIFGVTFMVVAAQHPNLRDLVTKEQKKEVDRFLNKIKSVSQKSIKDLDELNKEGVFTGSYAVNPATGAKIPIWAANFVIADYGSGMVMADAHDQRDLEFAHKYKINLIETILPQSGKSTDPNKSDRAFTDYGVLVKSGQFDGLTSKEAIVKITDWLVKKKQARKVIQYRLRDWGISRQRYWGTPIPIVHCEKCGVVPVPEKDLPVVLPQKVKFGKGNPLESNESWIKTKCPKCGGNARRETETMDTFVNSSWYFLRYCDPHNSKKIFDSKKVNYWCPVDRYIGGAEHACMHLIYCRFYTMFLHDLGLISFDEPTPRLFHQGILRAEGGTKMSKSKPETCVLPEDVSAKYGMDTARFFLSSLASPDKDIDWSEKGIKGSLKFINKIIDFYKSVKIGQTSKEVEVELNKTIKQITENIEDVYGYRDATIQLRAFFGVMEGEKEISKKVLEDYLKLLAPFCPHIAEELWAKLGNKNFICSSKWPEVDKKKLVKKKEGGDLNKKIIDYVQEILGKVKQDPKNVYLYVLPFEKKLVDANKIGKALGKMVDIWATSDKEKHDPQNKSKKARPGMPGVWFE